MRSRKRNSFEKTIPYIVGEKSTDSRGIVSFINNFKFENVKRFYQVENSAPNAIRAFHGHLNEAKYVYVSVGSILLASVFLDNLEKPSTTNPVHTLILSDTEPKIAYIPPRHANGFKTLQEHTRVIFFSTSTLIESLSDDYRYPADYWGKNIWKT